MSKSIENVPGQGRILFDSIDGNIIGVGFVGDARTNLKSQQKESLHLPEIISRNKPKPDMAYMNVDNLDIIRERVLQKGLSLNTSSYDELTKGLVVFSRGTIIGLSPKEELNQGYLVRFNIGVIACTTSALENDYQTPFGQTGYQILGVFNEYKGTGRVSTDKATRKYVTIQRSDVDHPQPLAIYECFFANPNNSIEVRKSRFGKTEYWWKK